MTWGLIALFVGGYLMGLMTRTLIDTINETCKAADLKQKKKVKKNDTGD